MQRSHRRVRVECTPGPAEPWATHPSCRVGARGTRDETTRSQGVGLALVDDMPDRTQLLKRRSLLEPLLVVRVHPQPAVHRIHSGRFPEGSCHDLRGGLHLDEHLRALLEVVGEAEVDVDDKLWLAWSLLEMARHASGEAEADGATFLLSLHCPSGWG